MKRSLTKPSEFRLVQNPMPTPLPQPPDDNGGGPSSVVVPVVRWMTLGEAVAEVQVLLCCDADRALRELREALAKGVILTSWDKPKDRFDVPPIGDFWRRASIDVDRVLLDFGRPFWDADEMPLRPGILKGSWRRVLVHRRGLAIWAGGKIKKPSEADIRRAIRTVYNKDDRPNVNQAEKLVRKILPNASSGTIRRIIRNDKEFASLKRKRGRPKNT